MVLVNIDFVAIAATMTAFLTLAFLVNRFWNSILGWFSTTTGSEIDLERLPKDSPLSQEFDKLHDTLTDIGATQEDLQKEISELKYNQKKIGKRNRGDILELKLMRGVDHNLPPEQIAEWYAEYKALGRNGAMDFVVAKHIHPNEFDYHKMTNEKGD